MFRKTTIAMALAGAVWAASAAAGAANLVVNGGFETTPLTGPGTGAGNLPGWNSSPYDYVWFPGTADVLPNPNALWGPADGAANGLPAASPAGGNFLEQDPYFNTPLTQTISGLTPGATYQLGFYWAAASWTGAQLAPTTRDWQVSLGAQTYATAAATVPAKGFQGWMHETMLFTPASGTELLSFLSQGAGDPPVALLDGVSLVRITPVPEPGTWAMLILGMAGLGAAARARRAAPLAAGGFRAAPGP